MNKYLLLAALAIVGVALLSATPAQASSVGFNFSGTNCSTTRDVTGGASNLQLSRMLSATDGTTTIDPFAGLYGTRTAGSTNWTDVASTGTGPTLSGVTITTPGTAVLANPTQENDWFNGGKTYPLAQPIPLANVDSAYKRAAYGNLFWTSGTMTVTFSGLSGTYDVYVRCATTGNTITATMGTQSLSVPTSSHPSTDYVTQAGKWILFTDLTAAQASTLTLTGASNRAYIGAIELVQIPVIPEPAGLGLIGAALLVLKRRRS